MFVIISQTRTRISSCAERLGYRKKNAGGIGIFLRQVVAASSTPLHTLFKTELYSSESMLSSAILGLILQQSMLTSQAFGDRALSHRPTRFVVDVVTPVGVSYKKPDPGCRLHILE